MPRVDETAAASKEVAFVLRPPRDEVFTAEAVERLVGQAVTARRIDGSPAPGTVVAARLDPDGSAVLTVDVVGGIDRAPAEREGVDTAG